MSRPARPPPGRRRPILPTLPLSGRATGWSLLTRTAAAAQGMQHNPGTRSIEDEVMGALAKAGAVAPVNAGKYDKVGPWALTLYAKALRKFNAPTRSGHCADAQSRRVRQQGQLCPLFGAVAVASPVEAGGGGVRALSQHSQPSSATPRVRGGALAWARCTGRVRRAPTRA